MATAALDASRYTGTNLFLKGLIWGDMWVQSRSNPITYAFATVPEESLPWLPNNSPEARALFATEKGAFQAALASWASVANLSFQRVGADQDADLRFHKMDEAIRAEQELDPGTLALQFGPGAMPELGPDREEYAGVGFYNWEAHGAWAENLKVGGHAYLTLVHEIGHALGLAHPHSTGGSSQVWGRSLKAYDDVINTVMSYNDIGQPWAPSGFNDHGFAGGPMAFDIAAIQTIYGARHNNTGDTTYRLPDTSSAQRYYTSIWDTGGTDRIVYGGSEDAVIDLRGATLDPSDPHAGGHLSGLKNDSGDWIKGNGGFTIAKDFGSFRVRIENAWGGSGDDAITGNEIGNRLVGRAGDDALSGMKGRDKLLGGAGNDTLIGGLGRDILKGGAGEDIFEFDAVQDSRIGKSRDVVLDFQSGQDVIDLSSLDAELDRSGNQRFAWVDEANLSASFTGVAGQLRFVSGVLLGDVDGDGKSEFQIRVLGLLAVGDVIL